MITITHEGNAVFLFAPSPQDREDLLGHIKLQDRFHYLIGEIKPNFALPAIRYTNELVHNHGHIRFCVMYRLPNNFMRPVGDSPQYPLYF